MKKKIFLIFIFILLVLLPSVFSVKTTQTTLGEFGLDIESPGAEYLKQNRAYTVNIHVFNRSNGAYLTNETTDCFIHLYNITGNHLIDEKFVIFDHNLDFEYIISAGNLSQLGVHDYIIQCNTTNLGGFIKSRFIVTPTGMDAMKFDQDKMIPITIAFILIILVFIIGGIYGLVSKAKIFQLIGFGVALIETLLMMFLLHLVNIGIPIDDLMLTNIYLLLGLCSFIAFIYLILFVFKVVDPDEKEEIDTKKWQDR